MHHTVEIITGCHCQRREKQLMNCCVALRPDTINIWISAFPKVCICRLMLQTHRMAAFGWGVWEEKEG